MKQRYFKQKIKAMESNSDFIIKTFDRQAVIDDINYLIRQLKITKAGISDDFGDYIEKRHVAEWLFMDSKQLDDIIEKLTGGGYDND